MRSFTLFLGQCVQREKTNIHYTVFRCICSNRERLGFDEELYIIFGTVCAAGKTRHILLHICSNRDRQLDLIRRFRLFLGQCMQHCSGREINPTPPSARYILSWKLSNDQWLFLGNTLVNVHSTVLALLWTIVKLWMRKLWLLMVRTNVLLNLFF